MSKPKPLHELSGDELREYAEHLMGFTFNGVPMPVGKINYPPRGNDLPQQMRDKQKQFDDLFPRPYHVNCRCSTDELALDTVLIKGEYRVPGNTTPEEIQELERDHESGDIRAEHTLALILGK